MNNEPVAWMYKTTYKNETEIDVISDEFKQSGKGGDCSEYSIPLYAHPAQKPTMVLDGNHVYPAFKELTDADIQEISHRYHYTYNPDYIGFARAILRKASEK